ncbi:hypothetical protein [Nostoc sp.]|uniref:hypothetical protein n=1 Tax=Nostoc sp. TaxID=1180 RepID=UPI002FF802C4
MFNQIKKQQALRHKRLKNLTTLHLSLEAPQPQSLPKVIVPRQSSEARVQKRRPKAYPFMTKPRQ